MRKMNDVRGIQQSIQQPEHLCSPPAWWTWCCRRERGSALTGIFKYSWIYMQIEHKNKITFKSQIKKSWMFLNRDENSHFFKPVPVRRPEAVLTVEIFRKRGGIQLTCSVTRRDAQRRRWKVELKDKCLFSFFSLCIWGIYHIYVNESTEHISTKIKKTWTKLTSVLFLLLLIIS